MKHILFLLFVTLGLSLVHAQITNIPNQNFEQALIDLGIDSDGTINGQVLTADIAGVINLNVSGRGITNLTGIEDFSSLEILNVNDNSFLNEFDVSQNLNLRILSAYHTGLSVMNVTNNNLLEELYLGNLDEDVGPYNTFTTLNLSNNPSLKILDCRVSFDLTTLDLTNNPNLEILIVAFCNLSDIDLSNNIALKELVMGYDAGVLTAVSNNFVSIDLSNNPNLEIFNAYNTDLENLNVKNGNNTILDDFNAFLNPDLSCIQVDDEVAANGGNTPYSVWVVDAHVTYSEQCSLGIESLTLDSFILYPNPSGAILNIQNSNAVSIESINIFDALGRPILEKSSNFHQVDISKLETGLYFVTIETEKGRFTSSIVKN